MVFGSPLQRNLSKRGCRREQAYANAAEVFRALHAGARRRGVTICMEPLTPKETNFINTCAEALRADRARSTIRISCCTRT